MLHQNGCFYPQCNVSSIKCLFECYYPLILRSVLTRTGRLNCSTLSVLVSMLSGFELFTERLMSNDDTSSRKLTVGWRRILNETCHIDWMLEFDSWNVFTWLWAGLSRFIWKYLQNIYLTITSHRITEITFQNMFISLWRRRAQNWRRCAGLR